MVKRIFVCEISGLEPIMFDRVAFDPIKTGKLMPLKWDEKAYFGSDRNSQRNLVMPTINIFSMLCNTRDGAPFLKEKKAAEARRQCMIIKRTIHFPEKEVFILRSNKHLTISDCYHHQGSAPDPSKHSPILTSRPVLELPWHLSFRIEIIELGISVEIVKEYLTLAGNMTGLGTNRGQFGKFEIKSWKEVK